MARRLLLSREEEMLERVCAFRTALSDQLYATCKDYRLLRNLMQEGLPAYAEMAAEMRRRLAGNVHYSVLTKLDEVHALLSAHIGART